MNENRDRLREEIEQWRREAQFKEDERVRLRAALEEISHRSNEHHCIVSERVIQIARNALETR